MARGIGAGWAGLLALVASMAVGTSGESASRSEPGHGGTTWLGGRLIVSAVDASLEAAAAAVFDELERKSYVRVLREDRTGGLAIRSSPTAATIDARTGWVELCCFDPNSDGAVVQRRLALALLIALGVEEPDRHKIPAMNPSSRSRAGASATTPALIEPSEADAVNTLYAAEILPSLGKLPASIQVGIYQLVPGDEHGALEDWSEMVEGRGNRVMAGASRLAKNLALSGLMPSLVGALPTFVFHGNKAEVVLLGPESAEFMPGVAMPPELSGVEGLGAGIRLATLHARGLTSRHLVGGVPTYLGDGSALLLRSAQTKVVPLWDFGESFETIIREHRSAIAWSRASRWAQGHGALLAIPSFVSSLGSSVPSKEQTASASVPSSVSDSAVLEVLLLHSPGFADRILAGGSMQGAGGGQDRSSAAEGLPSQSMSLGGALAMFWGTILSTLVCRAAVLRFKRGWGAYDLSRAERDLERLVASL